MSRAIPIASTVNGIEITQITNLSRVIKLATLYIQ